MFAVPYIDTVKTVLIHAAPALPPQIWWVSALVIFVLALAATIDAFTTTIPDELIFLGLLAVTTMLGLYASWQVAAAHLRQAIAAGVLIWSVNFVWRQKFKSDALGMGDAKWTMLAVACFGLMPSLIAWGVGACLAIVWMAGAWALRYQVTRVTFAPFLFLGLTVGLYWVRFAYANTPAFAD